MSGFLKPWISIRAARAERGDSKARHIDDEACAFVMMDGTLCYVPREGGRRYCIGHAMIADSEAQAQGGADVIEFPSHRTRIVLAPEDYDRFAAEMANPRPPTQALVDLFKEP